MNVSRLLILVLVLFVFLMCAACSSAHSVAQTEASDAESAITEKNNAQNSSISPDVAPTDTSNVSESNPIIMIGYKKMTLPVLLKDGRYLCRSDEGIYYAKIHIPNIQSDDEKIVKEELWVKNNDGDTRILINANFYDIEKAALSHDGKYLGVLDTEPDKKILYVVNLEENKLYNLGEEGLGARTSSFVWDTESPVIYALTGYNAFQLLKYDFSKAPGQRVSSVEELPGSDSSLQLVYGKLYFCDRAAGEIGEVYVLSTADPKREIVGKGVGFKIAPDAKHAALLQIRPLDEMTTAYNLSLKNLITGELKEDIAKNVEDFGFDDNSRYLYYTTQSGGNAAAGFPFALNKYNLETEETELLCLLKTGAFEAAKDEGQLLIFDYLSQKGLDNYVTYIHGI